MGGLNSLDGLWVDWIFGGCLADGGQADTLIYKLTHVRVCVCILAKGCPPVRPVYPFRCAARASRYRFKNWFVQMVTFNRQNNDDLILALLFPKSADFFIKTRKKF